MPSQPDPTSIMDLDFADLDSAWFFDQISASSKFNPSPDQISPPISAFAEFSHDKSSVASTAIRISTDCRVMTCKPGAATDNRQDDGEDDKKRLRYPVNGMARLEVPDMFIIKERMTQALRYFKESTEHQILAQVWAPVKSGSRNVLTTSGQPFILSPHSNGLHQYRTASLMYSFSLDGETDGSLGLPGRVFRQKLPEWTPDVQYYSSKEYPRVKHAKNYNVHGTLALPVFEPSGQSCVGVLELIMTAKKINYAPEVDKVCKALEAVNLRSSEILDHPNIQICNEGRQNALSEILEVLTEVCEAYKLPLAQTWVPCRHRNVLAYGGGLKKSCSSFDGSCRDQVCMSTTDAAFYVVDAHMWGFREACAEHHLQKGQGVAGKAFSSHGSCFCEAINRFSKREYPLVHYARMFGLAVSFSICLRSKYTGDDEYVLEFFLPPSLTESMPHHTFLDTILVTMKRHFRSLMVASGRTLEEERKFTEMVDVPMDENDSDIEPILGLYPSKPVSMQEPSNGGVMAPLKTCTQFMEEKDVEKRKNSPGTGPTGGNCNGISSAKDKESIKSSEKKRGKAEKQISFEVLQQYFAGSLKDAAKSLGVCPTTMKRICRQHGIPRWPSRKINKVNRSLSKLKRVIESVQGADGAFSLSNLSPTSVPGGSISWPAGLKGGSQQPSQCSKPIEFTYERIDLPGRTGAVAKDWQAETTVNSRGSCHEEEAHKQNGFVRGFQVSRAGSGSREASTATSTSHGSCQGSPATESTVPLNQFIPSFHEVVGNSLSLMFQPKGETNLSAGFTLPDPVFKSVAREPFGSILAEDASSSKDLRNLCSSIADVNVDEGIPEQGSANPPFTLSPVNTMLPRSGAGQDMRSVTIKATFREDIIRFRFCLHSNIVDLRDEVAKRFKIDIGTFEVKYLDDDNEWVLIACESDLQECLDIMRSSGSSIIRLSIHDMLGNPGSSCESSGG